MKTSRDIIVAKRLVLPPDLDVGSLSGKVPQYQVDEGSSSPRSYAVSRFPFPPTLLMGLRTVHVVYEIEQRLAESRKYEAIKDEYEGCDDDTVEVFNRKDCTSRPDGKNASSMSDMSRDLIAWSRASRPDGKNVPSLCCRDLICQGRK